DHDAERAEDDGGRCHLYCRDGEPGARPVLKLRLPAAELWRTARLRPAELRAAELRPAARLWAAGTGLRSASAARLPAGLRRGHVSALRRLGSAGLPDAEP